MVLQAVTLDDKYAAEHGRIFLTGTQALVRLPMMQRRLDRAAGLNTAGFVSGYRGSPLGGVDQGLWKAREFLTKEHIRFIPGLNEDLAATAVWGSQQVDMFPGARYDGVFAMWYGKGPGVDRSGDVFKHGNHAGSARNGGVLLLAGDDHACRSSSLPHQSEYAFIDASIPVLNPSGVQDILDYGLLGWAMSRWSGCWVAMKTIAETVDSSASVSVAPDRVKIVVPAEFALPPGGLNIRWPDPPLDQERRMARHKLDAVLAFARANALDRVVLDCWFPRFGIVTTGKSYLDVRQALEDLGIDAVYAGEIGIRVYKIGMSWPLEPDGIRDFARGLDEILVVEEKRPVIEDQLRAQLYNWREDARPRIVGKCDERGQWLLPPTAELTPAIVARVIAQRIDRFHASRRIEQRLAFLEAKTTQLARLTPAVERSPWFCSGCPHNTSTRVPEGSRAIAGIGCHYMALWMPDRDTATFTQMGGEGVPWIGQAPFTETRHVFANLGDGTYNHSGILAIRAAVAAGVNITYKILFNDAVAMTGGQPHDGGVLTAPAIARQVAAEGVAAIVIVTDEPAKYAADAGLPPGTPVRPRAELETVQRALSERPGVTVLIYDQTCAAELRRRRKRGLVPDPPRRVVINEAACEGCGDCSKQSNCLSIVPVETEFGRKRAIDQSSCNKDMSCLDGFCPSLVTVHGGAVRRRTVPLPDITLPEPILPGLDRPYGILIAGVGGTGVVTIGALLGMAAHIGGNAATVLDMTGLAQKGGAVFSHVRLAHRPEEIAAVRVADGGADLLLGCDMLVAASADGLAKIQSGRTRAVVNAHETITGGFVQNPDLEFPGRATHEALTEAAGADSVNLLDASRLAASLLGDSIGANLFLLGFAWQKGLVPLSGEALDRAIELNGIAIDFNRRAFLWGRHAAIDLPKVEELAMPRTGGWTRAATLDELIKRRVRDLAAYQDAAYAARYRELVGRIRRIEADRVPGRTDLTDAVARSLHKLMAYKDEYEVARLYTDGRFEEQLRAQFEGAFSLEFHLAPPLTASDGKPRKRSFGPWMMPALRLLARLKFLRGTRWDPFGYAAERRLERRLVRDYTAMLDEILAGLTPATYPAAVELARLPERVRGYGHVKEASLNEVDRDKARLVAAFRRSEAIATLEPQIAPFPTSSLRA